MKPSEDARQQAEQHVEHTDDVLVEGSDAEGHWPEGQHGPVHESGFDRSHQGAPRADDRSRYAGQSAYGSLDKPAASDEHQDSEHSRSSAGQEGGFGEGNYGGTRGDNERGGMSSYGNSSGSRYSVDNEQGTMARTAAAPLSREGSAPGAAKASTDAGQYANEYGDASMPASAQAPSDQATSPPDRMQAQSARAGGDDERIRGAIHDRLMDHPHLEVRDISVAIKSGRVTLEGSVPEQRTKQLIQDIVDNVNGVLEIDNRLEVARREDAVSTFASGYTAGQAYAAAHDTAGDPNHTGAATFGAASAKAAAEKHKAEEDAQDGANKEGQA